MDGFLCSMNPMNSRRRLGLFRRTEKFFIFGFKCRQPTLKFVTTSSDHLIFFLTLTQAIKSLTDQRLSFGELSPGCDHIIDSER